MGWREERPIHDAPTAQGGDEISGVCVQGVGYEGEAHAESPREERRPDTASASAFFVQYWGQIDESVIEQMQTLAVNKSLATGQLISYGIIDGQDTARIIAAYPQQFGSV